jgi:hypothetical protein
MNILIMLQVNFEVHTWATISVSFSWNEYSGPWVGPCHAIYVFYFGYINFGSNNWVLSVSHVLVYCMPLNLILESDNPCSAQVGPRQKKRRDAWYSEKGSSNDEQMQEQGRRGWSNGMLMQG